MRRIIKIIRCVQDKILYHLPDRLYLEKWYKDRTGERLHLKNPVTFNEKLQWLKLYDRNPRYTQMADKWEAKKIVRDLLGEQYCIPDVGKGIYDSFDEINFDEFPNKFVLKCTHDSGDIVICKDKDKFDVRKAREQLEQGLKTNYYKFGREWVYKDIRPRIIAEKYMEDIPNEELKDYKIFNFGGNCRLIQVDLGRFTKHRRNFYTVDWKLVPMTILYPNNMEIIVEKPECLEEMLECARVLSQGIPFLRTDFYVIHKKVYFGEMTFYPGGGGEEISPKKVGRQMGEWIDIGNRKCMGR